MCLTKILIDLPALQPADVVLCLRVCCYSNGSLNLLLVLLLCKDLPANAALVACHTQSH